MWARRAPSLLLLSVVVDRNGVNDDENLFENEISALRRRVRWTSSGSPRTMAMVCADDDKQARTLTLPAVTETGLQFKLEHRAQLSTTTTTATARATILLVADDFEGSG